MLYNLRRLIVIVTSVCLGAVLSARLASDAKGKCDPVRVLQLDDVALDTSSDTGAFSAGFDSGSAPPDSGDDTSEWAAWPETVYFYGEDTSEYAFGGDGLWVELDPAADDTTTHASGIQP